MPAKQTLLKSKMYWIAILYFSEGFPLGVFYDLFPVHFRQQGVALWKIGFMSLLGLSWTLKFLWAPAIDHYRHHRRWMFIVDCLMAAVMLIFTVKTGFGVWVWVAIACFTLLSATNDIAIDGYTIELLNKNEFGLANGLRIGFYRVGMLASGFILILSDKIKWSGAYLVTAILLAASGVICLRAPKEQAGSAKPSIPFRKELQGIIRSPFATGVVLFFLLGSLRLIDKVTKWSEEIPYFWAILGGIASLIFFYALLAYQNSDRQKQGHDSSASLPGITEGPMFGTLIAMIRRPHFIPVMFFILTFKLADSSMGFMIKPFWVDSGFTASEIGLVSVNIGLLLSILGGIAGGWFTDRTDIFKSLWLLGAFQAISNLGYALAAWVIPPQTIGAILPFEHKALIYGASAMESFTGGLGTAAFLAFLMAIVNKQHSATEYALLSSVFALSRSLAGWAGGFGAALLGYGPYFFLTFFLAFPAYLLLPWVKKVLVNAEEEAGLTQKPSLE